MKKFNRALTDLNHALDLAKNLGSHIGEAYTRNGRGLALGGLGNYEMALAEFESAIKLCPNNAWVYYNRGLTFERMGESNKALADFKVALVKNDPIFTNNKRKYAESKLKTLV